jgi:AraC-like DNA-binding protein
VTDVWQARQISVFESYVPNTAVQLSRGLNVYAPMTSIDFATDRNFGKACAFPIPEIFRTEGAAVRIGMCADQNSLDVKVEILARLADRGYVASDLCFSDPDCEFQRDVIGELARAIADRSIDRGILICFSFIGASMKANKYPKVRAAVCHDLPSVFRGVQQENMNVLVLGMGAVTRDVMFEQAVEFINASYIQRELTAGIPPSRLRVVVDFVRRNVDKHIQVRDLSEVVGMSESYFSRMFKVSTGLTPYRFILHERIHRAKELLYRGDTKLIHVASEVGFATQAHFTTAFGSVVGMTPRQFQYHSRNGHIAALPSLLPIDQRELAQFALVANSAGAAMGPGQALQTSRAG